MTPKGDAAMEVVRRRHASWANELADHHQPAALASVVTALSEIRTTLEDNVAALAAQKVAS